MKTKTEIIDYIKKAIQVDASVKPIMRVKDYEHNILAPERYCYRISFICQTTGKRIRYSVFPNTVGVQAWNLKRQRN